MKPITLAERNNHEKLKFQKKILGLYVRKIYLEHVLYKENKVPQAIAFVAESGTFLFHRSRTSWNNSTITTVDTK